jgi:hypothetical protein
MYHSTSSKASMNDKYIYVSYCRSITRFDKFQEIASQKFFFFVLKSYFKFQTDTVRITISKLEKAQD